MNWTDEERKAHIQGCLADGARLLPDSIRKITECFCGCGQPQEAWQWILDYLKRQAALHEEPTAPYQPWPPEGSSGAEWIAAYLLDHLGLTEHGTGIGGCWLTDAGREALAFLREHGAAWEEAGHWIDSEGVSRP